MNSRELLNIAKQILKDGGVEAYAFDAGCLFEHFFKMSRHDILISDIRPDPIQTKLFLEACKKRANGYPLQYILGVWEFYGIPFIVNESVLIPRADTETLIDYIIENYHGEVRILDMCCGSGCIGLTIKKLLPQSRVTLCDISDSALDTAEKNRSALGLCADIIKADVTLGFEKYFEPCCFDVIVSNPPYIKTGTPLARELAFEPKLALYAGQDGLTFYRALITRWCGALKQGGEIVLETGFDTHEDVKALLAQYGFSDIRSKKDAGGTNRLCAAKINC